GPKTPPTGGCAVQQNGGHAASAVAPVYRDVTIGNLLTKLAESLPDNDALVYRGGPRYTFAALEREARVIARGLMASGVQQGERVVIWRRTCPNGSCSSSRWPRLARFSSARTRRRARVISTIC